MVATKPLYTSASTLISTTINTIGEYTYFKTHSITETLTFLSVAYEHQALSQTQVLNCPT